MNTNAQHYNKYIFPVCKTHMPCVLQVEHTFRRVAALKIKLGGFKSLSTRYYLLGTNLDQLKNTKHMTLYKKASDTIHPQQ